MIVQRTPQTAVTGGVSDLFVPRLLDRPELMQPVSIDRITIDPLNATLAEAFPISSDRTSRLERADNVAVTIRSSSGVIGHGEAAPFFGIAGDTQDLIMNDLAVLVNPLVGSALTVFELESIGREALGFPSARAALEMAFLDVLAREQGAPLHRLLNPAACPRRMKTDVTIPLVPPAHAATLAEQHRKAGFSRIKIKIGEGIERDVNRVAAINDGTRGAAALLLDANEGYDINAFTTMMFRLELKGILPAFVEQPVKRYAIGPLGMAREVAELLGGHLFADESVFELRDALRVIEARAADGINLKIMKHGGIIEAMRIAQLARDSGLMLMVGGMVETRLAMTAGLHMAAALDDVQWLDLDTPLFIQDDGLRGGLVYAGPQLTLPDAAGIGVTVTRDT